MNMQENRKADTGSRGRDIMGRTENEAKKEYLRGYRGHVHRIGRIEAELEEIRAMRTSMAVIHDGMPHGSGQADLSGYAARLDSLERLLLREKEQRVKGYSVISARISSLDSENERNVLFYRYIKGLAWWEIAEKMGYSERQIHRFHGEALAHINILQEK